MIEKGMIKTAGIIVGSESLQDYVYKDKSLQNVFLFFTI